jgi:hypothetical protein
VESEKQNISIRPLYPAWPKFCFKALRNKD